MSTEDGKQIFSRWEDQGKARVFIRGYPSGICFTRSGLVELIRVAEAAIEEIRVKWLEYLDTLSPAQLRANYLHAQADRVLRQLPEQSYEDWYQEVREYGA